MMIRDFLSQFIEGYMFTDLNTMECALPATLNGPGHLGYPMFATCAAGIELMGTLLSPDPFDPHKGRIYFASFWERLYPNSPRKEVAQPVYRLARHGILHVFAGKHVVSVNKGGPHLAWDGSSLHINVKILSDDLRAAYARDVKPIPTTSLQSRLNEMLQKAAQDAQQDLPHITQLPLPPQPPPASSPVVPSSHPQAFIVQVNTYWVTGSPQ